VEVDDLIAVLDAADDLMTVVFALGTYCVDNRDDVRSDQYAARADTCRVLSQIVRNESFDMWDETGSFLVGPSQTLKDSVTRLSLTPSLAAVTVLEGICFGAARIYMADRGPTSLR
jgi:hypothetical protein